MTAELAKASDGELAALTIAGGQQAFAEIMRRHREPIYRLVRGHIGDPEEALDLVQECFVSAYKRLDSYDRARPFRAWLSRIAINKCRDWARRRAVRRLLLGSASVDEAGAVPDPAPRLDEAAADRQELDLLWQAIARLPRNLREPLILRTVEGLSQAETALVLRISEKAVETRVYRARKLLSQRLGAGARSEPL